MKKIIEVELRTIDTIKDESLELYKKIIEKNYDINVDGDWYDSDYDDIKTMLGFCGFKTPEIHFSGFSCQGDGANFTGNFYRRDINFNALAAYAPKEEFFLLFATLLADLTKPFEDARFTLYKSSFRYEHENTVDIKDFVSDNDILYSTIPESEILDACRKIMKVIYQKLEKQYEYLTSEDAIYETLDDNEYYFNDMGEIVE